MTIVSASYRSDIPAFHGNWFQARWREGFVQVRNPFGGPDRRVDLGPGKTDGIVFWTRNPKPFLPVLVGLRSQGVPFYLQVTVTGYPRDIERSVPATETLLPILTAIAQAGGRRSWVWRYDPVLFAGGMDAAWHRAHFARLAKRVAPLTDEVVFSWMHPYAKTMRNLRKAAIAWRDPDPQEKQALLDDLAQIAQEHGLSPNLCAQPALIGPWLQAARCIDVDRLSDLAGLPLNAKVKGNRPGCFCAEAVDIGAYDTCAHGCLYCYAVSHPEKAKKIVAKCEMASRATGTA